MTDKEFSYKSKLTIEELKNLPECVMRETIRIKEERLYGMYLSKQERSDLEFEIAFYEKALHERFEKHSANNKTTKKTVRQKEKVAAR